MIRLRPLQWFLLYILWVVVLGLLIPDTTVGWVVFLAAMLAYFVCVEMVI